MITREDALNEYHKHCEKDNWYKYSFVDTINEIYDDFDKRLSNGVSASKEWHEIIVTDEQLTSQDRWNQSNIKFTLSQYGMPFNGTFDLTEREDVEYAVEYKNIESNEAIFKWRWK